MAMTPTMKWSYRRHIITFVLGFLTAVAVLHLGSFSQLVTDFETFCAALTTIGGGINGYIAMRSARPIAQALSLRKAVPNTTIITSPEIAAATPDPGIISNAQTHVLEPVPAAAGH